MISRVPQLWTEQQRKTLIGLLVAITVYLSIRLFLNPVYVSDPQPSDPPRASEVEDRVDPNTADASTLAALPLIAQKRAEDIVTYRERYVMEHPGMVAFSKPSDLLAIRGIGTAMLTQIQPFLIFPKQPAPSSTQP